MAEPVIVPPRVNARRGTPGWLIAAGVLACIQGSLSVCGVFGSLMSLVMMRSTATPVSPGSTGGAGTGAASAFPGFAAAMDMSNSPESRRLNLISAPVSLVVGACMFIGGIAAFMRRRWAFPALIVACVLQLAQLTVTLPLSMKVQEETFERMSKDPMFAPGAQMSRQMMPASMTCGAIFGAGLPVAILILIARRSARDYFRSLRTPAAASSSDPRGGFA